MFWHSIEKSYYKILRTIYLQFILLFVYIPVLIYWGLPLSAMTVVGNIIFLPLLSIFLTLSFLIFFTELFAIPNKIFHLIFMKFSTFWLNLLNFGSSKWLIGFPYRGIAPLTFFILCGLLLFYIIKTKPITIKLMFSSIMLTLFLTVLKYIHKIPSTATIQTKNQIINIHCKNNNFTLVIPHIRLSKNNLPSWYFYEIQPQLIKIFGITHLKTVVLLNPTKSMINLFIENQSLLEFEQLFIARTSAKNKITYIITITKQKNH